MKMSAMLCQTVLSLQLAYIESVCYTGNKGLIPKHQSSDRTMEFCTQSLKTSQYKEQLLQLFLTGCTKTIIRYVQHHQRKLR